MKQERFSGIRKEKKSGKPFSKVILIEELSPYSQTRGS